MIPRRERILFAAGDIFGGGGGSLIAVLYLIFLTDIVGLQPALAGNAIFVARLWDAVNDPLVGSLSDRTRSRWGRRRPWIGIGALLLVGGMALMWMPDPPFDGQVSLMLWTMGTYIVYNSIQTMIMVPYISMSSEVAVEPHERNRINLTRLLFSTIASAVVTLVATHLVESHRDGSMGVVTLHLTILLVFGVPFAVAALGVAIGCRERVALPPVDDTRTWWSRSMMPLMHGPTRGLITMYICQALAMDVISAIVLYYTAHVVIGLSATVFLGVFIAVTVVAFPVILHMLRRHDKHRIYRFGMPWAMVAAVGLALYPSDWTPWGAYVLVLVLAVGTAGAQLLPWVMFPDVLDDAELVWGRRDSGTFAGLMTFTRNILSAAMLQVIGLVLQFTGYRPGGGPQPLSAEWGIRGCVAVGVVLTLGIGRYVSSHWPLTRERCLATAAELETRRHPEPPTS
ncbi:MFS transporter [Propioniferax innocua]|uniref:GPH family glycoside/pentoside/hexuronide:cation symporter/oligogalacturonide transporter n=1 Tax=Propioniferax innocua TaxID=1753 RepID=A0A542ZDM6_9ACTN|nr:MFS transporter [Propioniferax innocua]TQL58456.1 GPH family glycoside/pentoside/hexuronide:cation symporter/oligogalacturonide transporter [Propioniferax innocua]